MRNVGLPGRGSKVRAWASIGVSVRELTVTLDLVLVTTARYLTNSFQLNNSGAVTMKLKTTTRTKHFGADNRNKFYYITNITKATKM